MRSIALTYVLPCAIALLVPAAPGGVSAQDTLRPEGHWYLSCGAGVLMYEGDEEVEDGGVAALRIGYFVGDTWAVEGALHVAPELKASTVGFTRIDPDTGEVVSGRRAVADEPFGETHAVGCAVDCLYHFVYWERLVPYLTLGMGFVWYGDEINGSTFDPSLRVGGGVRYHFSDRWALRVDGRMLGVGSDTEANASVDAGVMWAWGPS